MEQRIGEEEPIFAIEYCQDKAVGTTAQDIAYSIGPSLGKAVVVAKINGDLKDLNYKMIDFHSTRPGHDLRYGLDGDKLEKMGWKIRVSFEESLKKTIEWTLENKKWLEY